MAGSDPPLTPSPVAHVTPRRRSGAAGRGPYTQEAEAAGTAFPARWKRSAAAPGSLPGPTKRKTWKRGPTSNVPTNIGGVALLNSARRESAPPTTTTRTVAGKRNTAVRPFGVPDGRLPVGVDRAEGPGQQEARRPWANRSRSGRSRSSSRPASPRAPARPAPGTAGPCRTPSPVRIRRPPPRPLRPRAAGSPPRRGAGSPAGCGRAAGPGPRPSAGRWRRGCGPR